MKVIKASELGVYLFCNRAWSYQQQGVDSENMPAMARGTAYHVRHGNQVLLAGMLKVFAVLCLVAALVVILVMILP